MKIKTLQVRSTAITSEQLIKEYGVLMKSLKISKERGKNDFIFLKTIKLYIITVMNNSNFKILKYYKNLYIQEMHELYRI